MSDSKVVLMSVSVAFAYFIWGVCNAILAPFFPIEAELKGATISQSGFVFGIYSLVGFMFSPLVGKYGTKMSQAYLYNLGAFIQSLCTLSFGFLHYINNVNSFLTVAYTLRILLGIANAASFVSLLAALMTLYPNKVAKIVAATELFFGIGYMLGPALGGLLYSTGGFVLPFLVSGLVSLLVPISLVFAMPAARPPENNKNVNNGSRGTPAMIQIPSVNIPLMGTFVAYFGFSMVEAMVVFHLKTMDATTNVITLGFFISGGCCMLGTIVAGHVNDMIAYPTATSIIGNTIMLIAFTTIGPLPFIPLEANVSIVVISLAVIGLGKGLVCISAFKRAHEAAIRNGFPDDTSTCSLLSGLWSSLDFLGCFLGPSIGGILVEMYTFRWTTILYWIFQLLILMGDSFDLYFNIKTKKYVKIKDATIQ